MSNLTRENFEELDRRDPLAAQRDKFQLEKGLIYLDGNSLGAMPKQAASRALEVVREEWGRGLITSWNKAGWFELPNVLGDKIGSLIGAVSGETVMTDSTSINLHKVLYAALGLVPKRSVILMQGSNFPTDNYIAQGLARQLGDRYQIRFAEHDDILDAIDEDIAAVCLTQVHYKTGRVLDMKSITAKAQANGAIAIWDLCHSAGALEVRLNDCNADFAVGCTYKYLNGGPGSPAFIFAARRHHGRALQPLTGWWGHAAPFAFERDYRPDHTIRQMLSGTQPILSMQVAEPGIDMFLDIDMTLIREKSIKLCDLFIELVESRCASHGFELVSPRDAGQRGSQVSFDHENGFAVMQALIDARVIGDFRAPKNMRFGFAPLYLRYVDVWDAVDRLLDIMEAGTWKESRFQQVGAVT